MIKQLCVVCVALVGLAGCGKEGGGGDAPASEAPKVVAKTLDTLFVGAAPVLPAPFKTLKLGMTGEEAAKVFPAMPKDETIRVPEYPELRFRADFDKKSGLLKRCYFNVPKDTEAMLVKAWGEPKKGKSHGDRMVNYWFNPAEGLRVTLEPGFGDELKVEFTAYIPAEQFVGAQGKAFAFEAPKALLGATIEELRVAYPKVLVEKSKQEADADRAGMEKMMGTDKDKLKVLGAPKPSAHLDFPPTEFESYWTRVNLSWDDQGKVRSYRFGLGFETYMEAKDPLFALLKGKFGELKEEEKYGRKLFVANDTPRVEINEDTISKGWDVSVEAVQP